MVEINERINAFLREQQLSYPEVAQNSGISENQLKSYLAENKIPRNDVKKIASALNVTASQLVGWDD